MLGLDRTRPPGLPSQVRFRPLDLMAPDAAARLAELLQREGVEVVVHLAFRRWPGAGPTGQRGLDVFGSRQVLRACAAQRLAQLVVAGTTQCYGAHPDNPNYLSEQHALRGHPAAPSVQDRCEVERLVADFAAREAQTATTVLRCCWTLGPEAAGPVARWLSRPLVPTLLGYDPLLQLLHERDCLAVFEQAALSPHPGVFNIVAPGVAPLSVLLGAAGKRALPLPAPLLQGLSAVARRAGPGLLTPQLPDGGPDTLRYLWVADGAKGWAEFGRPVYSTRETWAAFVAARRLRSPR